MNKILFSRFLGHVFDRFRSYNSAPRFLGNQSSCSHHNRLYPLFFLRGCVILTAGFFIGCASIESEDETKGWSEKQFYETAKENQHSGDYEQSTKQLEKLEARYPYGQYARQAQLEIAYNYFKEREPVLAIGAIDRFITQNPTHPNLDYAYYLRGLVYFNEGERAFLSIVFQQDMSERDPQDARQSFQSFQTLITRYPNSKYTKDATIRMGYLIGALATHELYIARYYYKRGAYLAAVNRCKNLLQTYPNTKQVEAGLGLMVLSYDKLGLTQLRDDAKRVLLKNYPNTDIMSKEDVAKEPYWWVPI